VAPPLPAPGAWPGQPEAWQDVAPLQGAQQGLRRAPPRRRRRGLRRARRPPRPPSPSRAPMMTTLARLARSAGGSPPSAPGPSWGGSGRPWPGPGPAGSCPGAPPARPACARSGWWPGGAARQLPGLHPRRRRCWRGAGWQDCWALPLQIATQRARGWRTLAGRLGGRVGWRLLLLRHAAALGPRCRGRVGACCAAAAQVALPRRSWGIGS
jgi:hypothetical protein